jgi:hypothetical protein
MYKEYYITEHKRLIDVLRHGNAEQREAEAKLQEEDLHELMESDEETEHEDGIEEIEPKELLRKAMASNEKENGED